MKLVINTQIRENYGAHDWDGKGECPQYWKSKGGNVFVVANLSEANIKRIREGGIPTLTGLIESRNLSFEETIMHYDIVEDDVKVCDSWETPVLLSWVNGRWVAKCTTVNGEYGYLHRDILEKNTEYTMLPGGDYADYRTVYTMVNGNKVSSVDLDRYLKQVAQI